MSSGPRGHISAPPVQRDPPLPLGEPAMKPFQSQGGEKEADEPSSASSQHTPAASLEAVGQHYLARLQNKRKHQTPASSHALCVCVGDSISTCDTLRAAGAQPGRCPVGYFPVLLVFAASSAGTGGSAPPPIPAFGRASPPSVARRWWAGARAASPTDAGRRAELSCGGD